SGREVAGAAGDVERALTGAQIRQRQRETLPDPMCARGHQIVHQVVVLGDRIEHAAHAACLVLMRYALKAEVGGALVGHWRCAIKPDETHSSRSGTVCLTARSWLH